MSVASVYSDSQTGFKPGTNRDLQYRGRRERLRLLMKPKSAPPHRVDRLGEEVQRDGGAQDVIATPGGEATQGGSSSPHDETSTNGGACEFSGNFATLGREEAVP